ncbi:MAG: hypothetical protein R3C14_21655 [Caldilineaceae bacterium]
MRKPTVHKVIRRPRLIAAATHVAVLVSYYLLTLVMTWPLATQFTTAIPGDSFDGWQNYWNLWWVKTALVDRLQNPYWTDLLYYPTGVGLYFHTLNPFNGLVTLPVQVSVGLLPAYNTVVLLSWVLGGYGVYLLALKSLDWQQFHANSWSGISTRAASAPTPHSMTQALRFLPVAPHLAAFLAGAIFTFAPFHMAHLLGHMQVMSLEWLPFYMLYLLLAVERSRQRRPWLRQAMMAGLFLGLAGLCDWYFVLYLFFFTGLVLLWYGLHRPRSLANFFWVLRPATVAGLLMLLLLSPLLLPMIWEATHFNFMVRPSSDLYILSASVLDFLTPNRLHTFWRPGSFTWPGNQIAPISERTISIGYLPLLLALVALWAKRSSAQLRAGFWWGVALLFFLLALGPRWHGGNITDAAIPAPAQMGGEWTPFALLNQIVPFMRISRSVSRYALMVQLAIAVLAAVGFTNLLQRVAASQIHALRGVIRMGMLSALVLMLVLAEFWVAPYPMSPPDTPTFYSQLRALPDAGAVLNLPMNYDRPGYLLYQTVHQKPLAVAYISRDDPRTLTERAPVLQHLRHLGPDILAFDPVRVGQTVLHDLGIGIVIQDRYKMPGGLERTYTEEVANAIFAGQPPLYEDERLTVQRVEPPAVDQPYVVLGPLNWGPLEVSATGEHQRALGPEPAALQFYHLPDNATLQVRYRTLPQVSVDMTTDTGNLIATLPPAPTGNNSTIALRDALSIIHPTKNYSEIFLAADQSVGAWIEEISLQEK